MITRLLVLLSLALVVLALAFVRGRNQSVAASNTAQTNRQWVCWDPSSANPCRHDLNDVSLLSDGSAWAVGELGHIQRWNGHTWEPMRSPEPTELWGIDMVSHYDGWAVGSGGLVLRWDGRRWSHSASVGDGTSLDAIDMISSNDGWAVGTAGLYRWDGRSWSRVPLPIRTDSYDAWEVDMVSHDDGWIMNGWSLGDVSSDGPPTWRWNGTRWSAVHVDMPSEYTLTSLAMVSAADGWMVGYLSDTDSTLSGNYALGYRWDGRRWSRTGLGAAGGSSWFAVSAMDSGEAWLAGLGMARYANGAWSLVDSPTAALFDIEVRSDRDGWAVGNAGATMHWDGHRWTSVGGHNTVTVKSVAMTATDDGWAVGGAYGRGKEPSGALWRWDGTSWIQVMGVFEEPLSGVAFFGSRDGWAVGDSGAMLRWNGRRWDPVASGALADLKDVSVVAEDEAWAVGSAGTILHWTGAKWAHVDNPVPSHQTINAVDFTSPDDGWAVWGYGHVLHWNGDSWSGVERPGHNFLVDIDMLTPDLGWAVGEGGIISWDGKEWSDAAAIDHVSRLVMVAPDNGWAADRFGRLYHWNGMTWREEPPLTGSRVYGLAASPNGDAWAVGEAGLFLRYAAIDSVPMPTRPLPEGSALLPQVRR